MGALEDFTLITVFAFFMVMVYVVGSQLYTVLVPTVLSAMGGVPPQFNESYAVLKRYTDAVMGVYPYVVAAVVAVLGFAAAVYRTTQGRRYY